MKPFEKYVKVEEEKYLDLLDKNEKLKELCDKYEKEHNNEFQCWKKDRRELLDKRQIIEKAIEYINDNVAVYGFGNKELPHWEFNDYNIQDLIKILKGEE